MAHRGRLNVLATLMKKPLGTICNEFKETDENVADVKYHLGTYRSRPASLPRALAIFSKRRWAGQMCLSAHLLMGVLAILARGADACCRP